MTVCAKTVVIAGILEPCIEEELPVHQRKLSTYSLIQTSLSCREAECGDHGQEDLVFHPREEPTSEQ